jgi:hypothetical protein
MAHSMKNPTFAGKNPTPSRTACAPTSSRAPAPIPARTSAVRALAPAVLLALFLYPGTASAKSADPAAASPAANPPTCCPASLFRILPSRIRDTPTFQYS